ncbi:Ail/Lom family outer membrane beta-barrel protein [Pseudomonas trivialis]|uniref:Virulence protein n=1 Tax=Pseudomonas trivialis TaxID=200450 RepID=A0A0H5AFA6_9PSED|nr:Ail/Lom family outer membrane beta-barrel protein [Pseudomonas trivialis]AKS09899.1 virulence protein [Pseudomonas trivialis]
MKKISIAMTLLSLCFAKHVCAGENTVTLGYAQSKVQSFKVIKGVNVKYRYEWDSPISLIGSFTYLAGDGNDSYYVDRDIIDNDIKDKYYSVSVGPAYRFNNFLSMYGLVGVGYSDVKVKSSWYNWNDGYEPMGDEKMNEKKSNFVYGAGLQINPLENFTVDVSYEGSHLKVADKKLAMNGFSLGLGYRF